MASSRIVELATKIASNTARINEYLLSHDLPTPDFDVDGPLDTLIPKHEIDVESARVAVIDDTLELRRLVLGPREYLMSYTHDELISQQAITRYKLAHSFPVGQEASFADIAATTGLDQGLVRRFIRHAVMKDIFSEPRPGVITHNAVSRLLAEDQAVHDWVGSSTDDLWQAAAQTCNAIDKWSASQEPNETGFALANGTDQSIYLEFSKYPERARRFGNAMRAFTEGTGFELSHVVNNFPWGGLKDGTVVDVGGSQGFASFAIARQFPRVSCVVQDLEPVISAAEKEIPADLADRVKFMTHDFFTEQSVVGADVYFFRWIFHNWSDKYSMKILRKHIPALKNGAKIVINDNLLSQPGVLSRWQEDRLRSMDLTMTEIQNSYEREAGDWARLFKSADPRFEFQGANQPSGSNLGFVVAEWKGDV
ncbi:putative S-adenosyl-L-methionine-dependent methyltransferase [Rosellinia necatrix]|uniref:Putative S-adenosyl-L-methionine-dependent methyltransferase n=1 Tax=Rosellinia necatrix TaxID=77044 RepID=A0A1S7UIM4_ROSNE|nr:putative S-adenosyl-L-methionine-dependent methyltransferase [Rosellinia necatrix]